MKESVANFNIHNIFRFRVISSLRKPLEIFKNKFYFFLQDKTAESDLDIFIGNYEIKDKEILLKTKDSICGKNFINFEDHYKLVRWRILLEDLEDKKWNVHLRCNHCIGYEAVITKVIRPLFTLKLAMENKNLIHGSAIAQNDKAYIFSAFPGVGKSSLSFFLSDEDNNFLSDENVLIDEKGNVYPFPLSIPLTSNNLKYASLRVSLNLREFFALKVGDMIKLFSRGFLEKSFSLQPSRYFTIKGKSVVDKIFIISKSPNDFFIKEISAEEGSRALFLINNYEMMVINKYLQPFLFVNNSSRLINKDLQILNNLRTLLQNRVIFHVNIDENDIKKSFGKLAEILAMDDNKKIRVKKANKLLYDKIEDCYELIDGRRSEELFCWLRNRLKEFSGSLSGETKLLDIGCGSGFVIKSAQGLFNRLYGMDISEHILKKPSQFADGVICADVDFIPLKDKTIDVVVLFSAIHHFYDFRVMLAEIYRVLKNGGILYIDHDLDRRFSKNFKFLLKLYRMISRRKNRYLAAGISERIYDLSEFHSEGIDKEELERYLKESGFEIVDSFNHWFGLNKFTNRIFGYRKHYLPSAPLLSIVASKVRK